MRNAICSLVLLTCAAALCACDPGVFARKSLDKTTRVLLVTDAHLQRFTRDALRGIAIEEGTAMGLALKVLGCPAGSSSQPSSAPEKCQAAARQSRARYEARAQKLLAAAGKTDQALDAAWASCRLVIDVVEDYEAGALTKDGAWTKIKALLGDSGRLLRDALAVYESLKALVAQ